MKTIEISCVEVWREISDYLEGIVNPEMRARLEAHFKTCAHCKAVLDGTRNVVRIFADEEVFEVPAVFSQRLFERLR